MKPPTQLQRFLDLFLDKEGKAVGRLIPRERWWDAPFRKARINGYIKASVMCFGPSKKDCVWFLTPRGENEARLAREYITSWVNEKVEESRMLRNRLANEEKEKNQ